MSYEGTAASGQFYYSTGDTFLHNFSALAGDTTGGVHTTVVGALQGTAVSATPPSVSGLYLRYNGSQWAAQSGDVAAHNLLSASHTDTTAASPVRGDVIRGVAGPTWARMALGTQGYVLYSDGTDVTYVQPGAVTPFSLGAVGTPSVTFGTDANTGFSAATADVLVASAGGSGLFRLEGPSNTVMIDGGYRTKSVDTTGNLTLTSADYVTLVTHSASCNIILPASPIKGETHIIKDASGVAAANFITVSGNGKNIDGNGSAMMRNNYASFTVLYNGIQWNIL